MNKFIATLKNIWTIKELRNRILFTLAMLAIYRFGSYVVLPGVVPEILKSSIGNRGAEDLLGLINIFTGGAFNQAAIFALGIMPYITASIIVQLLGFAVPYFQKLQQKEGESGRKKITQITRMLTILVCLVQASGFLALINSYGAIDPNIPKGIFWFSGLIILTAGTVFAMWLGEKITDRGIGNGISLLIMIGIIAALPRSIVVEFQQQLEGNGLLIFILEIVILFIVIMATVLITQGIRKIPIQFAKRMMGRGNTAMPSAGVRDYIPLKVNASGVMPIIFAQALMFLPMQIGAYFVGEENANAGIIGELSDPFSLTYGIVYFILIVIFTYVYTALIVNPKQYAEYLKRQNSFIPGIKPGKATEEFIDTILTRITLPGSIFLGIIAIIPGIAVFFGVNTAFALFFGGTSLLILVGVALDTLQQIESYLLMRKYDGLVSSGKLEGRSRVQSIGANM